MTKLDTLFPDPQQSTGLMLWRVTNSWQRSIRSALAPFDLTHVQFVLLAALTSMQGARVVTQRDLADAASTDPMMTSQVLRALEKKGLIERRAHPADGRAFALSPAEAGVAVVNRAIRAVEETDLEYFAPLGDKRADFTAMLVALQDRA